MHLNNNNNNNRYRYAGNGNSNARILKEIMRANNSIKVLDVSNTGLDDEGLEEVALTILILL